MLITKKLKNYILEKEKFYNDFLYKNPKIIEKAKEKMLKSLKKFYLEDKKEFINFFWKSFYDLENIFFDKLFPEEFISKSEFELFIQKKEKKEENYYLVYNNFYSENDLQSFKYIIYVDKNWNLLDKDKFIKGF